MKQEVQEKEEKEKEEEEGQQQPPQPNEQKRNIHNNHHNKTCERGASNNILMTTRTKMKCTMRRIGLHGALDSESPSNHDSCLPKSTESILNKHNRMNVHVPIDERIQILYGGTTPAKARKLVGVMPSDVCPMVLRKETETR